MNIVVPIKLVPDLVEELKINDQGVDIDPDWVRLKLNEFDDHAIEQAILLKERGVGPVIVVAFDAEGVDDALYTAVAKGADRIIKLTCGLDLPKNNHDLARRLAPIIKELQPGLVLTGAQAHNDLDGPVGPLLAEYLGVPYVGYVAGVQVNDCAAIIRKEFPGGLVAELETFLPAVFGIQASEQPPRYVAFNKIRQVMKSVAIEEKLVEDSHAFDGPAIDRMYLPEIGVCAEMIPGDATEVANRLINIFMEANLL